MAKKFVNHNQTPSLHIRLESTKIILPTYEINDIFRLPQVTPVPLTSDSILGVCNHRGRITTIFSLDNLLRSERICCSKSASSCLCLCLEYNEALYAFPVKSVDDFSDESELEAISMTKDKIIELLLSSPTKCLMGTYSANCKETPLKK